MAIAHNMSVQEKIFAIALGQVIAQERCKARMSQETLADNVGRDKQTILRLEKGKSHCRVFMMHAISRTLDLEDGELITKTLAFVAIAKQKLKEEK